MPKPELTTNDIVAYYDYEQATEGVGPETWGGYGYLNAISYRAAHTGRIQRGNEALIDRANQLGWTRDQLWTFLNSTWGRWFGEAIVGMSVDIEAVGPRALVSGITANGEYHQPKVAR